MTRPIAPGKPVVSSPQSFQGKNDRRNVDPQLRKAAEGMEAMFLDHLYRSMRKTVPDNPLSLESHATKVWRGMMDTELAQQAARNGGVGLADQIIDYLQPKGYHQREPAVQEVPHED